MMDDDDDGDDGDDGDDNYPYEYIIINIKYINIII